MRGMRWKGTFLLAILALGSCTPHEVAGDRAEMPGSAPAYEPLTAVPSNSRCFIGRDDSLIWTTPGGETMVVYLRPLVPSARVFESVRAADPEPDRAEFGKRLNRHVNVLYWQQGEVVCLQEPGSQAIQGERLGEDRALLAVLADKSIVYLEKETIRVLGREPEEVPHGCGDVRQCFVGCPRPGFLVHFNEGGRSALVWSMEPDLRLAGEMRLRTWHDFLVFSSDLSVGWAASYSDRWITRIDTRRDDFDYYESGVSGVAGLFLSGDGSTLVIVGTDGTVRFRTEKDEGPIASIGLRGVPRNVELSSDGTLLAIAIGSQVQVYRRGDSHPFASLGFSDVPRNISLSADGTFLAVSCNGLVFVYRRSS